VIENYYFLFLSSLFSVDKIEVNNLKALSFVVQQIF